MRALNLLLMKLRRRAEAADPQMLVQTFVDVGPLFTRLSSHDHQIFSGRRGTGKTHALYYLEAAVREQGDLPALVDMRRLGSSGGVYADSRLPLSERGTRLLSDMLTQIYDEVVDFTLLAHEVQDLSPALSLLDRLADEISRVRVEGEAEEVVTELQEEQGQRGGRAGLGIGPGGPRIDVGLDRRRSSGSLIERTMRHTGVPVHSIRFGAIAQLLERLVEALPVGRLWILLDEWSDVPMDLQPLLAELVRRALMPVPGITVKIGAIEQRSNLRAETSDGTPVGIEVGADAAADIDLDDFMVFGNDAEKAKEFFRELLFRHVRSIAEEDGDTEGVPASPHELARHAFTQRTAFDEFVRAAEGVPRDAINILMLAAQRADEAAISVDHVRGAARDWYVRDKEKAIQGNPQALALLHWVIDKVIGERRARAFLLEQGERASHPLIGALYDARVIHVIKRGVATHDRPGVRYDVYSLDYGCYVELMTTARAPLGLFEVEVEDGELGFVEVPTDDYRSIRRAILELEEFEEDYEARAAGAE